MHALELLLNKKLIKNCKTTFGAQKVSRSLHANLYGSMKIIKKSLSYNLKHVKNNTPTYLFRHICI